MARTRLQHGRIAIGAGVVALAIGLGACGGDESSLSDVAKRGKDTALSNGCASCHGTNGQGGVGPTWIDLAGSDVELEDGTTVVADDPYLIRSILEPEADVVAGYTIAMPANGMTEAQAADVVAYIKELTTDAP
ncbi:MAG: cytochrome c [Ilumatobacter sp.]|uniref:c-type cytochrome n=1 Tax=Ilumatobacter sp. TaxID=1967498 RepID=UPI003C793BCC